MTVLGNLASILSTDKGSNMLLRGLLIKMKSQLRLTPTLAKASITLSNLSKLPVLLPHMGHSQNSEVS